MSNAAFKLNTVSIWDPTVDFDTPDRYAVKRSGANQLYQTVGANQTNTTQPSWNINTPSIDAVMDRNLMVKFYYDVVFGGTAAAGSSNLLDIGVTDAPRAFPISAIVNTVNVGLNQNASISTNTQSWASALIPWYTQHVVPGHGNAYSKATTAPSYPDQSVTYGALEGTIRSPLTSYSNSAFQGGASTNEPNGAWNVNVLSNGTGSAHIQFTSCESLYLSPFGSQTDPTSLGMTYLNNLTVTMNMGNLTRIWSHDATNGGTINTMTVTFYKIPEIQFRWVYPDPLQKIPDILSYDYQNINVQAMPAQSVSGNATSVVFTSNSFQLGAIPNAVAIYIRQQDQDRTESTSDWFFRIQNVNITLGSINGIMGSATPEQLFNCSADNGYVGTFQQWYNQVGSVLYLRFGDQISLNNSSLAPGTLYTQQFSVSVLADNLSANTVNAVLYMVFIYPGLVQIERGSLQVNVLQSVLTTADVLNSSGNKVARQHVKSLYGGNFLNDIKSFFGDFKKGFDTVVKPTVPLINAGLGAILPEALPIAHAAESLLGYGGGKLKGRRGRPKKHGGSLYGINGSKPMSAISKRSHKSKKYVDSDSTDSGSESN